MATIEKDKRRPGTIKRHQKVIEAHEKLVKKEENAQFLSPTFFYVRVAEELGYEYETVRRIILAHRKNKS